MTLWFNKASYESLKTIFLTFYNIKWRLSLTGKHEVHASGVWPQHTISSAVGIFLHLWHEHQEGTPCGPGFGAGFPGTSGGSIESMMSLIMPGRWAITLSRHDLIWSAFNWSSFAWKTNKKNDIFIRVHIILLCAQYSSEEYIQCPGIWNLANSSLLFHMFYLWPLFIIFTILEIEMLNVF